MPEYRPVPPADERTYQDFVNYGFRPTEGPFGDDDDEWLYPEMGERRGVYEGDDLRSICRHYFWRTRVRGDWHDTAALTVVATPPEYRGMGYVGHLLEASLREYRDRGAHLSVLWPFDYGFYRHWGWAMANEYRRYECPSDALAFADDARSGRFRRVGADAYGTLDDVYADHSRRFELALDRPEAWWRGRVFHLHEEAQHVYAWERGDREAQGEAHERDAGTEGADRVDAYLVYTVETDDEGSTVLDVDELVYRDREGLLNCLRLLYDHDSQVDTVRLYAPPQLDLLRLVDHPPEVTCTVHGGPMVRVVDVPTALERLAFPAGLEASVVLEVTDAHADWNDGAFAVSVADGAATCEPTDAPPDASLDVATLSELYVGARAVDEAVAAGDVAAARPTAAETLASLFPESTVFFREDF